MQQFDLQEKRTQTDRNNPTRPDILLLYIDTRQRQLYVKTSLHGHSAEK